jgi:hypothetical protein
MNTINLKQLYDATEEDMQFGIDIVQGSGPKLTPLIWIYYPSWSRERFEIVRASLKSGSILVSSKRAGGFRDLGTARRENVTVRIRPDTDSPTATERSMRCPPSHQVAPLQRPARKALAAPGGVSRPA